MDKAVEIAVHDGVDVAGLVARTVVFDHRVRHKDVRADLRAPCDLLLDAFDVLDFIQMLALLDFEELAL